MGFDVTKTKLESGCFLQITNREEISLRNKSSGWLRIFYVEPGTRLDQVANKVCQIDHSKLNYKELETLNDNLTFLQEKMTKHCSGYFFKFFQAFSSHNFFYPFRPAQAINLNRIMRIKNSIRQLLPEKKWMAGIPRLIGLLKDMTQIQDKKFKIQNRSLDPQLPINYLSNMPITCCAKIFDYIVDPSNQIEEEVLERLAEAYLQFFGSLQRAVDSEEASNENREGAASNQCFMESAFAIRLVQAKLEVTQRSEQKKGDLQSSLQDGFKKFMNERMIPKENLDREAKANLSFVNARPTALKKHSNNIMQSIGPDVTSLILACLTSKEIKKVTLLNKAFWQSCTPEARIAFLARSPEWAESRQFTRSLNLLKIDDLALFPQNSIEERLIQRRNSYLLEKYMKIFLEHLRPQKQNAFFKTLRNDLFSCAILNLSETTVKLNLSDCFQLSDKHLMHLGNLPRLQILNLSYCDKITDVGLAHLGNLPTLEVLNLSICDKITDLGLTRLSNLPTLQVLNLSICDQITDAGLAKLGNLHALQVLNLSYCQQITDMGLAHFKKLDTLQVLDLSYCDQITDEGLTNLVNLHALQLLNLSYCHQITNRGIQQILSCLPTLTVALQQ
jgi:hypothetical protein